MKLEKKEIAVVAVAFVAGLILKPGLDTARRGFSWAKGKLRGTKVQNSSAAPQYRETQFSEKTIDESGTQRPPVSEGTESDNVSSLRH
jgi:hypothetical protein